MPPTPHLVTVWDPSRGDAITAHLALLLAAARDAADDDDVYVWWGKIRSPNRQQPLAHLGDILALDAHVAERETHLYLTDYRSLYVAHVGEVADADPREEEDAEAHVPAMYDEDTQCDCWFRLWDLRRLVHDDTLGVVAELKKLRNSRYHDRPVSIYGGMVELPLLVTRDDGARFFDPATRRLFLDGRLWAEFDAEQAGLGAVERDLRENMIGEEAWSALDPAARTFVATAERIFRDYRTDAAIDFAPVLVNMAKAVEVQVNAVLRRALRGAGDDVRLENVDGRTVDLAVDGPWTLGQLGRLLAGRRERCELLARTLANGAWFTAQLPPILDELAAVRNPGAHGERVPRDVARRLRDQLVGVACTGTLVELGRVVLRR